MCLNTVENLLYNLLATCVVGVSAMCNHLLSVCRHLKGLYTDENKVYIRLGIGLVALTGMGFAMYKILRALR